MIKNWTISKEFFWAGLIIPVLFYCVPIYRVTLYLPTPNLKININTELMGLELCKKYMGKIERHDSSIAEYYHGHKKIFLSVWIETNNEAQGVKCLSQMRDGIKNYVEINSQICFDSENYSAIESASKNRENNFRYMIFVIAFILLGVKRRANL